MATANTARVRRESLRVSSIERAGWHAGVERLPEIGERVYCVEGSANVVKVLTRLSDGSRLLELSLHDGPKTPYFAASSNVLLRDGDQMVATELP